MFCFPLKIGAKRIHLVRVRGGNLKHRALRLDTGNFSWASECLFYCFLWIERMIKIFVSACTRKTRVIDVVYNASNNELVRTKTLVKGLVNESDKIKCKYNLFSPFFEASKSKRKIN
jgi:small subunit ribosomal protein S8e